ncbi:MULTISPECIES: ABC transporter permease subunit [unclassified Brevundimonas]|uniref:ABC transporter permease subunit n=1 Tax=unclassified Brevundimonas TaxID=2622653 RepID=UPI0025C2229B|nr:MULTISPECIES: ABC transporter permease subunit [unclassified Brevundimonas]
MLADAIRSESWRLLQNRTAIFWSIFFVPVVGLLVSALGFFLLKSKAAQINGGQLPPELSLGGPLDLGQALASNAGDLANPAILAFLLIGAATLYAGDYRWETWRLISARNSRPNLLLGKVGVLKMLALAAMLIFLLSGALSEVIKAAIFARPLTFTFGATEAGQFGLLFLLSFVRVVQFLMISLLAATVTRSLLAALFIPLVLGIGQFFLGGPFAPLLGLEPGDWLTHLLLPGAAFETLKTLIKGGMAATTLPDGVAIKAIVSLALWSLAPLGAAIAWFSRQDLSKE